MRILGVASASAAVVLGLSSSAFACSIGDFKAEATCTGDKGQIVITDKDSSRTKAHVIVFEKNDAVETQVAEADVTGSAQGTQTPIDVDWKASTTYRVEVKVKSGRFNFDKFTPDLVTPATACKKEESPTPTASDSPSPTKSAPAESATPTPSASDTSSAPAATSSNAPSPAAGDSNLAETGANSNTPLIAGIAAALVVVGGGAVFFGMRRRGARDNG